MFKEEMKTLIKFAMEKNITALETRLGYNGAPILRITSNNLRDIELIKEWCENLGYSTNIIDKTDLDTPSALRNNKGFDLFCIFGDDTIDLDIFELKLEN